MQQCLYSYCIWLFLMNNFDSLWDNSCCELLVDWTYLQNHCNMSFLRFELFALLCWFLIAYTLFFFKCLNYYDHVSLLQLDSWSVILNGSVEVTYPDSRTETLCMGNSFGVSPTMEKEYMKGVMKTKVDDCQVRIVSMFLCCSRINKSIFAVWQWDKHVTKCAHVIVFNPTVTHSCRMCLNSWHWIKLGNSTHWFVYKYVK